MTTTATATSNQNRGLLLGLGAYGTWGLFPAFFPLLKPATAFEVLAHRIVWTLLLMFVVLAAGRRLGDLRRLSGRTWGLLVAASALISLNWGIYIYAVSNGHVVDAALGYFINPLVSVALGVAVFGERLNRAQATALAIGAAAVIVLAVQAGEVPAIGLGLAVSFGVYGAVKKVVPADPRVSVGVEAGLAAPFAVAYLVVLTAAGQATVPSLGAGHTVLMMLCGPVTAPVWTLCRGARSWQISFANAAARIGRCDAADEALPRRDRCVQSPRHRGFVPRIGAIGTLWPHCRGLAGFSPAERPGSDVVYLATTNRRLAEKAAADTKTARGSIGGQTRSGRI